MRPSSVLWWGPVLCAAVALGCSDKSLAVESSGPAVDTASGDGTDDGGDGKDEGGDGSDGGDGGAALDEDGDGFASDVDCDDENAAINPEATEVCDGVDNDCDGATDDADDDLAGGLSLYTDGDGDGHGDPDSLHLACAAGAGEVERGGDCDDTDGAVHPEASEVCDGVDNDCDGAVDDEDADRDPATAGTWHADDDGDGYGDAATATVACVAPPGHVADATDCDDTAAAANPAGREVCDGLDNDCDGLFDADDADVDLSTGQSWYADADADGYGDPATGQFACSPPAGHVADATDCDDTVAAANPGATEICDGLDNDCDGATDDADASLDTATATAWHDDDDGDGYGDAATAALSCTAPAGAVADSSDCDDADSGIHPGAAELCDGVDDDCDGTTSDEAGQVSFTPTSGAMVDITATVAGTAASPGAATLATDGTVTFCDGTHFTHLTVAADVTLESAHGAATTALDGGGSDTVVAVATNGIAVVVDGLTIQNGQATASSGEGGGIDCYAGSTLSVVDAIFDSNTGEFGGGIGSAYCLVSVTDSSFTANTATYGGGIAALYTTALSVDGATFDSNTATTSGADILVLEVDETTVNDSVLSNGSAAATSGSLFIQGTGTERLTLSGSQISGASAAAAGGLFVYDAEVDCTLDSSIRGTTATTTGAVYVGTDATFTSHGCDLAEATATDDNDADVRTGTSGAVYSDYGDDAWFQCSDEDCGGIEYDGLTGSFALTFGYDTSTPVTTTNCSLAWSLSGTGLDADALCTDCEFGFDVVATYDSAASVDDGTCGPLQSDLAFQMAHASDYGGYGYDLMLRYDSDAGDWYPWWVADFDGTDLVFYYSYADYYLGSYGGSTLYGSRYELGEATVY